MDKQDRMRIPRIGEGIHPWKLQLEWKNLAKSF